MDFNTSVNSANTPVKNSQKVTVEDAKGAWDYNIVVLKAEQRTLNPATSLWRFAGANRNARVNGCSIRSPLSANSLNL